VRKIREDPTRFDAATLGRSVDEYCAWISRTKRFVVKKNSLTRSWGGEIELAILSEYFQVGIGCVDVKTGHVYNYGTSQSHTSNLKANPTRHAVF
jgi:ubiquitin thioesterase OTU1